MEKERLSLAIEQSSETILITDKGGQIRYVNPAFEKITGYKCHDVFGKNPRFLKSGQQDEAVYKDMWGALSRGEVWSGELINKKKDGTFYIEDVTISPVFDNGGGIVNYIAVKRDITHEVEMEDQLRQKYIMEAVGLMAGGIAHNFNNNLAIILGNVELSQIRLPEGSGVAEYLNNAKIAIMRSRDLVQQILTYSRDGEGVKLPVQLPLLIDETIKLLRSTLPATIDLQKAISASCYSTTIHADSSRVQEALINLCNNAVYAMDEQGILTIGLDAVQLHAQEIPAQFVCLPGRYVKLSIHDTGSGIAPEHVDKVFDPFFTTKDVNEGTGMGLATVHSIIAQHNGMIKVASHPGEGTTFELYFPMVEQGQSEQVSPIENVLPRGDERILFVDDDEMLSQLGETMLSEMGYQVTAMTSSVSALELFRSNPDSFDLVITDQTMPELCGKDLIENMLKVRPDLATILCTGFSSKIDKEAAEALGCKAFCMKPLNVSELVELVREVLDSDKKGSGESQ